jgi:FAD synthase
LATTHIYIKMPAASSISNDESQSASAAAVAVAPPTLDPAKVLPLRMTSKVVKGFGRGSKDLGIPTANLDRDAGKFSLESFDDLPTGE